MQPGHLLIKLKTYFMLFNLIIFLTLANLASHQFKYFVKDLNHLGLFSSKIDLLICFNKKITHKRKIIDVFLL